MPSTVEREVTLGLDEAKDPPLGEVRETSALGVIPIHSMRNIKYVGVWREKAEGARIECAVPEELIVAAQPEEMTDWVAGRWKLSASSVGLPGPCKAFSWASNSSKFLEVTFPAFVLARADKINNYGSDIERIR